jgi:hypothetical protein
MVQKLLGLSADAQTEREYKEVLKQAQKQTEFIEIALTRMRLPVSYRECVALCPAARTAQGLPTSLFRHKALDAARGPVRCRRMAPGMCAQPTSTWTRQQRHWAVT